MIAAQKARLHRASVARRGFTLTELLIAMAIIVVIAGVTAVSVRAVARDARLASAQNTVSAALDTARGLAIRDNRLTVVVFRPRIDGRQQRVEIYIAQWTREAPRATVAGGVGTQIVDRFEPVPGVAVRRLPRGIKVAGPAYGAELDDVWQTQSHFPADSEAPGFLIGVMYSGDGTVATRNPVSDSNRMFIDFNSNRVQDLGDEAFIDYSGASPPSFSQNEFDWELFLHTALDAEPFVSLVPFLAIFDDDRCRAEHEVGAWIDPQMREDEYTEYITNHADRIHFNRYTGVVLR